MFIRFLVKKWLGGEAKIVECANGKDVVELYKSAKPNIVFLDIHLPGKSGKDALRELMRLDPTAFVIMLSADSNKDNVLYSIKTGAKAFITKPFTRETLFKYFNMCPTVVGKDGTPVVTADTPAEAQPKAKTER